VLLVTSDLATFDRLMPLLRRDSIQVHRLLRGEAALKLACSVQLDVIVIAHPLDDIATIELLKAARSEGSPCRATGIIVLVDDPEQRTAQHLLECGANRLLRVECTPREMGRALADLLGVAIRTQLRTTLRVAMSGSIGRRQLMCQTENISSSGMLIRGPIKVPLGTKFEFEFSLPNQAAPLRGLAQVARHTNWPREKVQGIGATFISFRGDARQRLEMFIDEHAVRLAPTEPSAEPSRPG
jgi:DNA-binding NarL/FixJ family response regulator